MLNASAEAETVAAQILRWSKTGDEKLPGLTRRRHAEQTLFLEPANPHQTQKS